MLIVTFQNIHEKNNIADYRFQVFVNKELIKKGKLKGHCRNTGWEGLILDFVKWLKIQKKKPTEKTLPENRMSKAI